MKRRRIAIVGPCPPYRGGIAQHTARLYHALRPTHDVAVFNFSLLYPSLLFPGKSQTDRSQGAQETPSERMINSVSPLSWRKAAQRLRDFQPDLALFQWWHPFFAPAYASIARGLSRSTRTLFLCHNSLPHESARFWTWLAERGLQIPDAFLVHSEQDRKDILACRPNALIHKAFLPLHDQFPFPAEGQAACRARLGIEAKRVLLFFGLIRKYKGLPYLLEALAQVRREEDVHLVIAGEFYEDRAPYDAQIARLGLQQAVHLFDHYIPNEEVGRYFAAADAVALPYLSATQSGVVLTAYAFDKPVITTRVGGLPEVVQEGKTGFTAPPQDAAQLACAIHRFYEQGGEAAFAPHVRCWKSQFSWERFAEILSGTLP